MYWYMAAAASWMPASRWTRIPAAYTTPLDRGIAPPSFVSASTTMVHAPAILAWRARQARAAAAHDDHSKSSATGSCVEPGCPGQAAVAQLAGQHFGREKRSGFG